MRIQFNPFNLFQFERFSGSLEYIRFMKSHNFYFGIRSSVIKAFSTVRNFLPELAVKGLNSPVVEKSGYMQWKC